MLFSQGYPIGFHIQQMTFEAVQELRIAHRWKAIRQEADAMRESRFRGKTYFPFVFSNGDSLRQLLARSRYLLFKPLENGFGNKRTWERFFSPSIQTCRKLIPCHIP
jgi:transposase